MLPAVHAIVEMDDIEPHLVQNQCNFLQQHGIGEEARCGKACNKCFPGEFLFNFRVIVARDRIADKQDTRPICFVRMGDPDVAPLDGLA